MITMLLLGGLLDLLTAVLDAIPDLTLPFGTIPETFAGVVGGALGGLDAVVPITEVSVLVGWVLTVYLPVVFAYATARWVFTHLPVIGNGG